MISRHAIAAGFFKIPKFPVIFPVLRESSISVGSCRSLNDWRSGCCYAAMPYARDMTVPWRQRRSPVCGTGNDSANVAAFLNPQGDERGELMVKAIILSFACAVVGSFFSVSAWAFPVSSLDRGAFSDVTPVAQGCGPGFHRGPYGRCRPDVVVVPPRRVCPFGMHYSPFRGRCVPN